MKQLKRCRHYENKFTVATAFEDFSAFPYEGVFPYVHVYYVFDTESEMLEELKKADIIFTCEVDAIYYNKEDITTKYLEPANVGYKLLDCWGALECG